MSDCPDVVAEGQPETESSDFQQKTWRNVANAAKVSNRIRPVDGTERATPAFSTIPLMAVIKQTETAACQPKKAPTRAVIAGTLRSERLLVADSTSPNGRRSPRINPTMSPQTPSASPPNWSGTLAQRWGHLMAAMPMIPAGRPRVAADATARGTG